MSGKGSAAAFALATAFAFATPALADESAAEVAAPLPSKDIRWSGTLGGAVDVGSLPRAAPGVALGFDVRRGALGARLAATAFVPQRDHAAGVDVGLFDAMAMICALAPVGSRFDFGACGGGGVGLLRADRNASGTGPAGSGSALRPQGLATTRWDAVLVPGLLLSLEAGVVVDPLRTRLPLDGVGVGDASRSSLVSFRGALGVLVRFW